MLKNPVSLSLSWIQSRAAASQGTQGPPGAVSASCAVLVAPNSPTLPADFWQHPVQFRDHYPQFRPLPVLAGTDLMGPVPVHLKWSQAVMCITDDVCHECRLIAIAQGGACTHSHRGARPSVFSGYGGDTSSSAEKGRLAAITRQVRPYEPRPHPLTQLQQMSLVPPDPLPTELQWR